MALGQLNRETQLRIGLRELATGLVLGGTMALLGFIFASRYVSLPDAAVVAATVALVVTLGTVNGTLLPMILKRGSRVAGSMRTRSIAPCTSPFASMAMARLNWLA